MASATIDLVVTDLDGTLWDGQRGPHVRTVEALRVLAASGVPVLAATSRRPTGAMDVMRAHQATLPAILFDGALGVDCETGRRFHRAPFDRADCAALVGVFLAHGLEPCLNIDDAGADFVVGNQPSTHPGHVAYNADVTLRADVRQFAATRDVLSLIAVGVARGRLESVLDGCIGRAEATLFADHLYGDYGLSVRRLGVTKWAGVQAFCRDRGIDEAHVLAAGDGENDLELLAHAAVACVPEDGCGEALELATHTIPPARDGGWATILDFVTPRQPQ